MTGRREGGEEETPGAGVHMPRGTALGAVAVACRCDAREAREATQMVLEVGGVEGDGGSQSGGKDAGEDEAKQNEKWITHERKACRTLLRARGGGSSGLQLAAGGEWWWGRRVARSLDDSGENKVISQNEKKEKKRNTHALL